MKSKKTVDGVMNICGVSKEEAVEIENIFYKNHCGVKLTANEEAKMLKVYGACFDIVRLAKERISEIDRLKKEINHQLKIMRMFGMAR